LLALLPLLLPEAREGESALGPRHAFLLPHLLHRTLIVWCENSPLSFDARNVLYLKLFGLFMGVTSRYHIA
jgi:hypothetical protein